MKYYVYILLTVDNTYYTGIATDVLRRFEEHKTSIKGAKYTKSHPPREIVYIKEFQDKSSASKEEYRIKKTLTKKQKTALIEENSTETAILIEKLINQQK